MSVLLGQEGTVFLVGFFLFMLPAQAVGLQEFHEEKIKKCMASSEK